MHGNSFRLDMVGDPNQNSPPMACPSGLGLTNHHHPNLCNLICRRMIGPSRWGKHLLHARLDYLRSYLRQNHATVLAHSGKHHQHQTNRRHQYLDSPTGHHLPVRPIDVPGISGQMSAVVPTGLSPLPSPSLSCH